MKKGLPCSKRLMLLLMLVLSILLSTSKILNSETTSAVTFPERAAFPDASQAVYYALAAPNDVEGFWAHFASNRG